MKPSAVTTVLFTGYAPVHFLCFRPIYERLVDDPRFNVFVSGGLRTKLEEGVSYDAPGLYEPLGVPAHRVLSVEAIQGLDFDVLFGANTKPIGPRHARATIQIFHGISFRNVALREAILAWDYFFFVGPYMRRRFAELKLVAETDPRGLSIGFPKTDRLVDGSLNRAAILVRVGLGGARPVVLYAPTGEKHNSLETLGEEAIQRLAAGGAVDVVIKLHDHPRDGIDWRARLAPLEGPHVRIAREVDVVPLLFASDLLITDASSVSNEFSLLDRPLVFLDVPKLISKSQQKHASLDLQTWGRRCGVVVERPEEVVSAVESGLRQGNDLSPLRRAMAADLFYHPGRAAEMAIQQVHRIVAEQCGAADRPPVQGVTSR
jgi:CDP-glycerol glycerophosphotransferase (TagB/SpsB family)